MDLPNDEPWQIQKMLDYFYTLDYSYTDESIENPTPDVRMDARMCVMRVKYGVQGLKIIASRKFERSFTVEISWPI